MFLVKKADFMSVCTPNEYLFSVYLFAEKLPPRVNHILANVQSCTGYFLCDSV